MTRLFLAALAAPLMLFGVLPLPAVAASPSAIAAPTRFSVEVVAAGPDVIFIPGLSSSRAVWAASAARLKRTHRVHLVQIKGFGEAAGPNASGPVLQPFVDDLAAYIRARRLKAPAVVGHSMGGLAALMLASQHPALAGRAMVVDAFPFIGPVFGASDVAAITPRAEQMRAMLIAGAAQVKPDFAASANCPADLPPPSPAVGNMTNSGAGACLMKLGAKASDLRVVGQAMYDDMVTDLRPHLGAITAPVTLLYPQDDRLLSRAAADKLYADGYAGTRRLTLVRIPNSYHFIMQDQPQAFADALDAFLR